MTTVIIPAHNEANVIVDAINSLLNSSNPPDEIIVVCNNCTDNTADLVRNMNANIKLIETPVASKIVALNLGDEIATSFPRIYMDADVRLSPNALERINETLTNSYLATAPRVKMDCEDASWFVRAYYDAWLRLPYCNAGMIGAGMYALSREGRMRFDKFPNIVADDGYIRALFKETERTVTNSCYVLVNSPKTLQGLIKIKTRSRIGGYELQSKFPELLVNEDKNYGSAFIDWILNVQDWAKIFVYISINLYTKFRARRLLKKGDVMWERDDTSRDRRKTHTK